MSGRLGSRSARRLPAGRAGVLGSQPAGVEEETRGKSAGDDGEHHRDDDDARAGESEGQRIELHIPAIFAFGNGVQVGPKVTSW